jgi:hypothetical protein
MAVLNSVFGKVHWKMCDKLLCTPSICDVLVVGILFVIEKMIKDYGGLSSM